MQEFALFLYSGTNFEHLSLSGKFLQPLHGHKHNSIEYLCNVCKI